MNGAIVRELALLLLLSAPLAGCSDIVDRAASRRPAAELDSLEGVTLVRNPAEPLLSENDVRVTELWSRPLDRFLMERRSWEPAPLVEIGGTPRSLVVLAPNAGRLLVVEPDSGRTRAVVRPSEGEGRPIEEPIGLAVLEDRVFVGERHSIEVFGLDGEPLEQIRFPVRDSQLDRALQLHRLDSASALSLVSRTGSPVWRRFAADGEWVELPPPHAISRQYPAATERRCWRVAAGSEGPILASCFFPVVVKLDSAGEVEREIVVEGGADSAGSAQLEQLRVESRARWREHDPDLPLDGVEARVERDLRLHAILDQYRAVRRDPATGLISVLAETPEYLGGGEARVRLFSEAGVYLASVGFSEYWLHYDALDSVLYAVTRDEEGVRWLRAYRVELPPSAHAVVPSRARSGG